MNFLKRLDGSISDGTILRYLYDGDKMNLTSSQIIERLVIDLVADKRALEKENKKQSDLLKEHKLYDKLLEN